MVSKDYYKLSISKQCQILSICRSGYYYQPVGENELNLKLMRIIDEEYLKYPFFGSRQMQRNLHRLGHKVSRHKTRRLMQLMGLAAIYQKPRTNNKNPEHKIYPYLLKNLNINKPNQVWSMDITYIPVKRGFLYLVAILDWYSRKVLSWRLSNTQDTSFCISAIEEAINKYGSPEISNSDQGSQFTSMDFTNLLKKYNIKISMDGKGRWMDNVFIERLWRSLKYECIYLEEFENGLQAKVAISEWIEFYNTTRPHSTFNGQTPDEVYYKNKEILAA
jgi:putative transposase